MMLFGERNRVGKLLDEWMMEHNASKIGSGYIAALQALGYTIVPPLSDSLQPLVGSCEHDYKNAERLGRCHHICPKCKEDITLELVFISDAGIDVDQWLDSLPNEKQ